MSDDGGAPDADEMEIEVTVPRPRPGPSFDKPGGR